MKHFKVDLAAMRVVELPGMDKPEKDKDGDKRIGKRKYPLRKFIEITEGDYKGIHFSRLSLLECGHKVPVSRDMYAETSPVSQRCRLCWEDQTLTSYPLASIPEGWKDGDVVTEGEFDICHQQWLPKTLSSHGEWINVCKDDANRFKRDTRIIAVPIAKDVKEGGSNFVYTQPDSHFWTSIEMMLNFYNHYKNGDVNANYIIIGLQNTLKNGYDIQSLPSPSGKEDEPAGNKIFRIYKQMPDNPLRQDAVEQESLLNDIRGSMICGMTDKELSDKYFIQSKK